MDAVIISQSPFETAAKTISLRKGQKAARFRNAIAVYFHDA
jgi:hypothetical protein